MSDIGVLYFHFPRRNAEKGNARFSSWRGGPSTCFVVRPNGKRTDERDGEIARKEQGDHGDGRIRTTLTFSEDSKTSFSSPLEGGNAG